MQPIAWVGLGYTVPAEPSKCRVYVWRKLKDYGATYFKQGVAILPKSPQNAAKFSALAAKIREMGGDATMIELRFIDAANEMETVAKFQQQSENEYRELMRDCACLMADIRQNLFPPSERSDRMRKMVGRFAKAASRDYFRSRTHTELAGALDDLAGDMAGVADEIGRQLRNTLDL